MLLKPLFRDGRAEGWIRRVAGTRLCLPVRFRALRKVVER